MACVPPEKVAEMWPHVERFFSDAVRRCGDWTVDLLRDELSDGALLWIVHDGERISAAAITRLIKARQGLTCNVIACGGAGEDWPTRLAVIENYAAKEGCKCIRVGGRKGWSRVFRDYGLAWVTLEKRLPG